MNYKILYLFAIFFLVLPISYSCNYESEITQCNSEIQKIMPNNATNYIYEWSSMRGFDDFVCLQAPPEKRVAQIAMDLNFREIDEEMDIYLEELSSQKDKYFWAWELNYFDWVNDIRDKAREFKNSYLEACVTSYEETIECTNNFAYSNPDEQQSVSIESAIDFLGTWGSCWRLANVKTDIFIEVAYNTLLLNQQQVQSDTQKLYEQETRTKYNKIIDLFMINLWYLERIWQKTPSLTRNPLW